MHIYTHTHAHACICLMFSVVRSQWLLFQSRSICIAFWHDLSALFSWHGPIMHYRPVSSIYMHKMVMWLQYRHWSVYKTPDKNGIMLFRYQNTPQDPLPPLPPPSTHTHTLLHPAPHKMSSSIRRLPREKQKTLIILSRDIDALILLWKYCRKAVQLWYRVVRTLNPYKESYISTKYIYSTK